VGDMSRRAAAAWDVAADENGASAMPFKNMVRGALALSLSLCVCVCVCVYVCIYLAFAVCIALCVCLSSPAA
jgi:hypothetical protein